MKSGAMERVENKNCALWVGERWNVVGICGLGMGIGQRRARASVLFLSHDIKIAVCVRASSASRARGYTSRAAGLTERRERLKNRVVIAIRQERYANVDLAVYVPQSQQTRCFSLTRSMGTRPAWCTNRTMASFEQYDSMMPACHWSRYRNSHLVPGDRQRLASCSSGHAGALNDAPSLHYTDISCHGESRRGLVRSRARAKAALSEVSGFLKRGNALPLGHDWQVALRRRHQRSSGGLVPADIYGVPRS